MYLQMFLLLLVPALGPPVSSFLFHSSFIVQVNQIREFIRIKNILM